jgi:hypothetical protein
MIRILLLLLVSASGFLDGPGQPEPGAVTASVPVAIVTRIKGEVTVTPAPAPGRVRLFDRLEDGQMIRTAPGAEAVLVFRSGARVRIGQASRARISATEATRMEGTLESLPPVPAVPLVAPVAGAGTAITAVRIRAGELTIVGPADGASTLVAATVLEFEPAAADGHDVEIEDPDAALVFRVRSRQTRISVPPEVLQPGLVYRWRVKARLPTGFEATGEGRFRTLAAGDVQMRAALREALATAEAEGQSLLAEVDWTLGLWPEALDGFRAARATGASDPVISERIAELERRLAGRSRAQRNEDR